MIQKRSPSRAGLEEVLVFVQAHLAPEMNPADARRILTSLVRGPEAVIDLWDEQGRLAAAAVVDTCTTADDVAELALLGLRERELSAEALQVLFACAEELTRQVLPGELVDGRVSGLVDGQRRCAGAPRRFKALRPPSAVPSGQP